VSAAASDPVHGLAELQAAWSRDLLAPDAPADVPGIVGNGLSPVRRFQIHRNHIALSLGDSLAGVFAACRAVVGEKFFRAAARTFIRSQAPTEPCLAAYGAGFADFLAEFPPAAGLPYLTDLARLEWAMHASFHAPADAPLSAEDLAELPPERMADARLPTRASLRLVRSPWPIDAIWQATREPQPAGEIDLDRGGVHLCVLRAEWDVVLWRLSVGEWHWLAALADGAALGAALERAVAHDPEFALADTLAAQLTRGAFAS